MTSLPPLSNGLLLSSSSDPLAPIDLRLASLLSYPCTAIVSPIKQKTDSDPPGISAPIAITAQTQLSNKNTPSNPSPQTTCTFFPPSSNLISNPTSPAPAPASATKHTQGITLAFPALATGSKCFPHRLAARIAVATVWDFLKHPGFWGGAEEEDSEGGFLCLAGWEPES
ncbi:hypothetical protein DID88_007916 [Monilinia fructigena]|uniref:Uncharacterized protein n=1 Tax=Monilinia fructigena TaxID=38457 RepID=A0A395J4Q2_9HELO|nr:hypothetical protein DID88_007916 [Monilinia fructigena]